MSKRIKVQSRVSTEARRFDRASVLEIKDRWSYNHFGDNWANARVFGRVVDRVGAKLLVEWDIDGERSPFEASVLHKEDDDLFTTGM